MLAALTVVVLAAATVATAHGAEIVLRQQATLTGSILRLGDVADIGADSASQKHDLATTPLMPVPAPGTVRFLRAAEIRDMLTARGISLAGMTFGGADIVAVGERQKSNSRRLNRYLSSQRRKEIVAAVEQAIAEQLNRETGPSRRWHIEPVLNIEQLGRLDQTELRLVAEGGTPPWTGKQVFRLSTPDQDEPSHVAGFTVTANIEPVRLVVVSRVPIERGAIVRATDVELREVENHLPTQAITSLDRVVGMIAMRALRPETQLQSRDIRAPLQVERGETVTVVARTSGIRVRTFAVAKQDGCLGDLVQVETLDKSERYDARVVGRGKLEVLATGATVEEFATLNQRNRRLR